MREREGGEERGVGPRSLVTSMEENFHYANIICRRKRERERVRCVPVCVCVCAGVRKNVSGIPTSR